MKWGVLYCNEMSTQNTAQHHIYDAWLRLNTSVHHGSLSDTLDTVRMDPMAEPSIENLDIGNGYPCDSLLPNKMVKIATNKLFETCYEEACYKTCPPLAYGDDSYYFRSKLASMLTLHSGRQEVDPDLLVPTAGVSHSLDILCTLLMKDKPHVGNYFVFMEDTSYFLTMGMFLDRNLPIRPLRVDDHGVVVDDLRKQLQDNANLNRLLPPEQQKHPLFAYIIPEFHNPTGVCLTEPRRQALVALAQEYDLMVVCDEVYQMLDITHYVPRPINYSSPNPLATVVPDVVHVIPSDGKKSALPEVPAPLLPAHPLRTPNSLPFRSMSEMGSPHMITVSSFSKILAPGLRVGWIEFPNKQWVDRFNDLSVVQSAGSICHFASSVVAVLMDDSFKAPSNPSLHALDVFNENDSTCPLYSHLHNLRVIYGIKYQVLTTALVRYSHEYLGPLLPPVSQSSPYLPIGFNITGYRSSERIGGYFLWIKLPEWCRGNSSDAVASPKTQYTPEELQEIALREHHLILKLGNTCAVDSSHQGPGHGYVRMCFARLSSEKLEESAKRFCAVLASTYRSLRP